MDPWRRAGYLTTGDVASLLGVAAMTVHRWFARGRLKFSLSGRRHFVRAKHLKEFLPTEYPVEAVRAKMVEDLHEVLRERARLSKNERERARRRRLKR